MNHYFDPLETPDESELFGIGINQATWRGPMSLSIGGLSGITNYLSPVTTIVRM